MQSISSMTFFVMNTEITEDRTAVKCNFKICTNHDGGFILDGCHVVVLLTANHPFFSLVIKPLKLLFKALLQRLLCLAVRAHLLGTKNKTPLQKGLVFFVDPPGMTRNTDRQSDRQIQTNK